MKTFLKYLPAALLILYLLCAPTTPWNNQMGPWAADVAPEPGFIAGVFFYLFVLFFGISLPLRKRPAGFKILLTGLLVLFQVACVVCAWPVVAGKMAQGIDHPAFLFRLHEFFEVFPFALGSYNPFWNAGTEHFIGVTSGAHNFGILMSPFLLFLPLEQAYSAALLFWLVIGFPWLTVIAFRRTGMRLEGALAGGLALLAFTRAEFLFFWQSGNLGGMVAALLAPILVAIGYRIAVLRKGSWADVVLLAVSAWLSCIWTPGVFTCAGLFLGWLFIWKRWTRKSATQMLIAGGSVLVLLSPWLWTTFFPARGIVDYVATGTPGEPLTRMLNASFSQYARRLMEWHPLILVFGLCALTLPRRRFFRKWTLPIFVLLSGVVLSIGFKRTSQLDRVAIQMAGAMLFPAAVLASRTFAPFRHLHGVSRIATALCIASVLATLTLGGRIATAHCANKAGFKLWPANEALHGYADWIRDNVPADGRLAFAGITDCKFEWGKPTYLPILTGREMMSDDYYGYPKGLTERNYPPKFYRRSDEAWIFFSDIYGISHWAVTDSRSKKFFDAHPESFELADYRMLQSTHVYTYRRVNAALPSRCLIGEAAVSAKENAIAVSLRQDLPDDALVVLRYNWRPGLRCRTEGAEIAPYAVDENIRFIAVRPHGNPTVHIGYRPTAHPLQPNFDGTFHH